MATVFLIGGFFYSLAEITVYKTTLSPLAPKSGIFEKSASTPYLSIIKNTLAKELENTPATETSEVEQAICQPLASSLTLANPELQQFKQDELCAHIPDPSGQPAAETVVAETPAPAAPEMGDPVLYQQVNDILKDTPMKTMVGPISKQDRTVAAFLVGIAFKESTHGRFAPHKNGKDCYNYWGFKGPQNPTSGGYSCFASPEQAVEIVGAKIATYIAKGRTTPATFTTWKCGNSCAGHSKESVAGWISGVSKYFYQIKKTS